MVFVFFQIKIKADGDTSNYIVDPREKIKVILEGEEPLLNSKNNSELVPYNVSSLLRIDKVPERIDKGMNIKELKKIEKLLKNEAIKGSSSITTDDSVVPHNASEIKRYARNIKSPFDITRNWVNRNLNDQDKLELEIHRRNPRCEAKKYASDYDVNSAKNTSTKSHKVDGHKLSGLNVPEKIDDSKNFSRSMNMFLTLKDGQIGLRKKPDQLNAITFDSPLYRQDSNKNDEENFSGKGNIDASRLRNADDDKIRNESEAIVLPGILEFKKPNGINNEQLRRIHRTRKDRLLKHQNNAQFYYSGKSTQLKNKDGNDEGGNSDDSNEVDQYQFLLPIISSLGSENISNNLKALNEITDYLNSKPYQNLLAKLVDPLCQKYTNSEQPYILKENSTKGNLSARANRSLPLYLNGDNNDPNVNNPDLINSVNIALLQKSPDKNIVGAQLPCADKNPDYLPKIDYNDTYPLWMLNLDNKSRIEEISRLDREELVKENELQKLELEKIKKFNEILQLQLQEQLLKNTNNFRPLRIHRTVLAGTETEPFVEEIADRGSNIPKNGTGVTVQNYSDDMYKVSMSGLTLNEVEEDLSEGNVSVKISDEIPKRIYKMNFSPLKDEIPENLLNMSKTSMDDGIADNLHRINSSGLHQDMMEMSEEQDQPTGGRLIAKPLHDDVLKNYTIKLNLSSSFVSDINPEDIRQDLAGFMSDNVLKVKDPRIIKALKQMDASLLSFPTVFNYNIPSNSLPHKIKQRNLPEGFYEHSNCSSNMEINSEYHPESQTVRLRHLGNKFLSEDDNDNIPNIPLSSYLKDNKSLGSVLNKQSINSILHLLEPFISDSSIVHSKFHDDTVSSDSTVDDISLSHQEMNKRKLQSAKLLPNILFGNLASDTDPIKTILSQKNNRLTSNDLSRKKLRNNDIINKLNDFFGNSTVKFIIPYQHNSSCNNSRNLNNLSLSNNKSDSLFEIQNIYSHEKSKNSQNRSFDISSLLQIGKDENVFSNKSKNSNRTSAKSSLSVTQDNRPNFGNGNSYNPFATKRYDFGSNCFDGSKFCQIRTGSTKSKFKNNHVTSNTYRCEDNMTTGNCLKVIGFVFEFNDTTLSPLRRDNFNGPSSFQLYQKNFSKESDNWVTKGYQATGENYNNDIPANDLNSKNGTKTIRPNYVVERMTTSSDCNSNVQPNLPLLKNIFSLLQSLDVMQNNKTKNVKPKYYLKERV